MAISSKTCIRCVMDSTDLESVFDEKGICNHCHAYDLASQNLNIDEKIKNHELEKLFEKIKQTGKGKDYDCLMGLSGGVDSSYIAYLANKFGLRPLCVHLDNGWNSELAVKNIHQIIKTYNFDLSTHVLDWEEFKDLQVSFLKAGVVDIEMLSDHAIFGVIMQLAKKHKIKTILSGANFSTEFVMPKSWVHRKQDLENIKDIQKKFGHKKLKTFPQVSTLSHVLSMFVLGYTVEKPLNLFHFNKKEAKDTLIKEFSWQDYGGKHYESFFTKFYQAYILPVKFKIDKRRAHLASLVLSGQITREKAMEELAKPLYNEIDLKNDFTYVCKKLGITEAWLHDYMKQPAVPHLHYKSDQWIYNLMMRLRP